MCLTKQGWLIYTVTPRRFWSWAHKAAGPPGGAADDLGRAGWISGAAARREEPLGWASQRAAGGSRRGRGAAQLPGVSRHSSAGGSEQFDF